MAYKWVYDKLTQGTTDFGMPSRYLDPPANTQRNPEYAGTDGESRFKIELEYAMKAKLYHETRLKNSTWAFISTAGAQRNLLKGTRWADMGIDIQPHQHPTSE
jgi:hypothetical protein